MPAYSGNSAIPKFKCFSSYILGLSMPRNLKAPTSWLGNPVLGFPNVGIWETRLSKVLEMWHSNLKNMFGESGARNLRCRLPKKEQVINIFVGAWNLNLSQQRRSFEKYLEECNVRVKHRRMFSRCFLFGPFTRRWTVATCHSRTDGVPAKSLSHWDMLLGGEISTNRKWFISHLSVG